MYFSWRSLGICISIVSRSISFISASVCAIWIASRYSCMEVYFLRFRPRIRFTIGSIAHFIRAYVQEKRRAPLSTHCTSCVLRFVYGDYPFLPICVISSCVFVCHVLVPCILFFYSRGMSVPFVPPYLFCVVSRGRVYLC